MLHEAALASTIRPSPPSQINLSGDWINELGSAMTLIQAGSALTGQYTSQVSGGGGSVTGLLVGWINGQVVSFTVNWPQPSITAWIGHLVADNGVNTIETLWHLATTMQDPNDPSELWNSVLTGADVFKRQSPLVAAPEPVAGLAIE